MRPAQPGQYFPRLDFGTNDAPQTAQRLPAPPEQERGVQLPVKGQDSHTEPAAHEGIGNALDAHARLPVVQKQAVSPVIITALMHKAAGLPGAAGSPCGAAYRSWLYPP